MLLQVSHFERNDMLSTGRRGRERRGVGRRGHRKNHQKKSESNFCSPKERVFTQIKQPDAMQSERGLRATGGPITGKKKNLIHLC